MTSIVADVENNVLLIDDFALLRHRIWLRKTYGVDVPAQESQIIDGHHYTNIWRELDRNSIYLFNKLQRPHDENGSIVESVLDTIRFRLFNKIETNEAILGEFGSLKAGWENPLALYSFLSNRKYNFTGAYIRCPDLTQMCYATSNEILQPIGERIAKALYEDQDAKAARAELRTVFSIGDFLADQLLMDFTWLGSPFERQVMNGSEFFTPSLGPGARAGLAYAQETRQGDWSELLSRLQEKFQDLPMPTVNGEAIRFDERALEHTLCEYFKHVKYQKRGDAVVKMRYYKPAQGVSVDLLPYTWEGPVL